MRDKTVTKIISILVVCFFLVACDQEKANNESRDITKEQPEKINNETVFDPKYYTLNENYGIALSTLENNDKPRPKENVRWIRSVMINYPQLYNMEDTAKENRLNDMLFKEALNIRDIINDRDYIEYSIDYEIMEANDEVISIHFTGFVHDPQKANNITHTVTIDLDNERFMDLSDTQKAQNDELKWTWCIKPKYSELYFVDKDLIAVEGDNGKYTIVNTSGEIVIPFEYLSVSSFEDGFASVTSSENAFFINKKGENVFNKGFEDAGSFSDVLASVKKDGLWGFIDKSGNMIIKSQYDEVKRFNGGMAVVEKDNKWGVIDKSGNILIDYQYDCINDSQEDIVAVAKDDKWGFIDKSGRIIADIQYDEVKNFSEGLAAVMKKGKWGFIDKNGNISIALKYDHVENFSEGKASVKLLSYQDGEDEWAYIDSNDNIVIDFYPYDAAGGIIFSVGEFNEGLAFVSKTFISIIDSKGNNILLGSDSVFFISSLSYNSEYNVIPAYVYTDETMKIKKYGLMGLTGNKRLEPIFDYVGNIYGDYVIVESIVDGEYKKGLIRIYE